MTNELTFLNQFDFFNYPRLSLWNLGQSEQTRRSVPIVLFLPLIALPSFYNHRQPNHYHLVKELAKAQIFLNGNVRIVYNSYWQLLTKVAGIFVQTMQTMAWIEFEARGLDVTFFTFGGDITFLNGQCQCHGVFSWYFKKSGTKPWLSDIVQTRKAPLTLRERYEAT